MMVAASAMLMANSGADINLKRDGDVLAGNTITDKNIINVYKVKDFANVTSADLKKVLTKSLCNDKDMKAVVETLNMPIIFVYVSDAEARVVEIDSCK